MHRTTRKGARRRANTLAAYFFAMCILLCAAGPSWAQDLLHPAFQDNMVLQAGKPVRLSGHGEPGARISVKIGNKSGKARVSSAGDWFIQLSPPKGEGPFSLQVESASGETKTIDGIVFGDVWLCSGQSNMDLPVSRAAKVRGVLSEARRYDIRIAKVEKAIEAAPSKTLQYAIPWSQASSDSVTGFSSVCWHMGQELSRNLNRPIGLIQSTWGGTKVEDWITADALRSVGGFTEDLHMLALYAGNANEGRKVLWRKTNDWAAHWDEGSKSDPAWSAEGYDDSDWRFMSVPGSMERSGLADLEDINGAVWFRRSVTLTEAQAREDLEFNLGIVNERDSVWVNGELIGQTEMPSVERRYHIPARLLKEGVNIIAVRVIDVVGSGGMSSPPETFGLVAPDGAFLPLEGNWKYRIGANFSDTPYPPFVPWKAPRGMTTLYNAMIHPLAPLHFKGVAWYQGESNVGAAENYPALMHHLMSDWRTLFEQKDLPFVAVQLPGFGAYETQTAPSDWARLREAQRVAMASDRHAGLAVIIDLGVPDDIHPTHKENVGRRLGWEALRVAYGQHEMPVAPYPVRISRRNETVVVSFPNNAGLQTYGADAAIGFELCTDDEQCRFVIGSVSGDDILLPDPDESATIVRYAWASSPIVNLVGKSDLPAAPFSLSITGENE